MYVPQAMRLEREQAWGLIERHGFAALVGSDLEATHLPLLLDRSEGELGTLYGHFARANPHWRTLADSRVLAIFNGPHAYISPTWYASRPAVPTWNYLAVHATGALELLGTEATRELLDRSLAHYEPALLDSLSREHGYLEKMRAGVVGFRLPIETLTGKAKLGRQRSQADQAGVEDALAKSRDPQARQLLHGTFDQRGEKSMTLDDVSRNDFGQPVGTALPGWQPAHRPGRTPLQGQRVRLEPLLPERHADSLYAAFMTPGEGPHETPQAHWTYYGGMPFADAEQYRAWLKARSESDDPLCYAIVETADEGATGRTLGLASYLNIVPEHGSIEVGHIHFTPALRRTPAATEAMLLLMRHAFELGYRRYEWKCDALNAPSRCAAKRLGFRFEGIFRQHQVVNGRNRDSAWFSLLDSEWPTIEARLERWLAPENFDDQGRQLSSLSALMQEDR